jgi:1-deoxy-D-xylulose-5-phosphate synthase
VLEHLAKAGALDKGLKIRPMTLPDVFQDQDSPAAMYAAAGLTARHIASLAIETLGRGDVAEIERLASA